MEDGCLHGEQPGVDGAGGEDEFGGGVGFHEVGEEEGGGEVEDGLSSLVISKRTEKGKGKRKR